MLPEHLDEHVSADNPVRVVDGFVDELDLGGLASIVCSRQEPAGPLTTLRCCESSTSTATSNASSQAGASKSRRQRLQPKDGEAEIEIQVMRVSVTQTIYP